jgi:hypothetical protein
MWNSFYGVEVLGSQVNPQTVIKVTLSDVNKPKEEKGETQITTRLSELTLSMLYRALEAAELINQPGHLLEFYFRDIFAADVNTNVFTRIRSNSALINAVSYYQLTKIPSFLRYEYRGSEILAVHLFCRYPRVGIIFSFP